LIVDDNPLLFGHEREFHNFWALISRLLMRVNEWRRHQRHVLARQMEFVGHGGYAEAKRPKRSGE